MTATAQSSVVSPRSTWLRQKRGRVGVMQPLWIETMCITWLQRKNGWERAGQTSCSFNCSLPASFFRERRRTLLLQKGFAHGLGAACCHVPSFKVQNFELDAIKV